MPAIFIRSLLIAIASMVASLGIAAIVLPATGGTFDLRAILMCTLCPLAIAWPASAHAMLQKRRLHEAHEQLNLAHAELADAHARLGEKARRDDHTGMLNREAFFATMEAARRKGAGGALIIVDADNFKTINDTHGHQTGDDALLEITAALCRASGKRDVIGRVGGEEFAIYTPENDEARLYALAERMRREVEKTVFRTPDGRPIELTISIGVSPWQPGASVSELFSRADRRLYQAKRRGRNRVVLGPDEVLAA